MATAMMKEFKAFINKGNVIDLAVAVVIGAAFNEIIKTVVSGVIMPVVGLFLPKGGWEHWTIWKIQAGAVLDALLHFLIIAFVIFLVLRKFFKAKKEDPAPPPPPEDILLLREIRDALKGQAPRS